VRIIAATHRNLEERIAQGSFREDLYYRLNVVPVEVPPLRERLADLPLLVATLAARIEAAGGAPVRLLPETLAALQQYRWPGNVRELANLLERIAIQCAGQPARIADLPSRYQPAGWIPSSVPELSDPLAELKLIESVAVVAVLPPAATSAPADAAAAVPLLLDAAPELPAEGIDLRAYLENLERRLISQALASAGGTVAHAARLLGLRRTTLVEKLRKYDLAGSDLSATGT
jgi:sigma-54 specific flagellar transcriptional regulator A